MEPPQRRHDGTRAAPRPAAVGAVGDVEGAEAAVVLGEEYAGVGEDEDDAGVVAAACWYSVSVVAVAYAEVEADGGDLGVSLPAVVVVELVGLHSAASPGGLQWQRPGHPSEEGVAELRERRLAHVVS